MEKLLFLLGEQGFIIADSRHALTHHSRCVGHGADHPDLASQALCQVGNGVSGCNGDDHLVLRHHVFDLPKNPGQHLGLYSQDQVLCLSGALCVGARMGNPRLPGDLLHFFLMGRGKDHILRGKFL